MNKRSFLKTTSAAAHLFISESLSTISRPYRCEGTDPTPSLLVWRPHMAFPDSRSRRSLGPAIALFFLAPLVAEFLLGNLPIQMLPALVMLGPMCGGGALLIRESVRRAGRGWPSILFGI